MGGHIGKPGNACSDDQYYGAFNSGPALAMQLPIGPSFFLNSAAINPIDDTISTSLVWDAVLDGKYWCAGHNMAYIFKKGEWRDLDIHVIASEHHNWAVRPCPTSWLSPCCSPWPWSCTWPWGSLASWAAPARGPRARPQGARGRVRGGFRLRGVWHPRCGRRMR